MQIRKRGHFLGGRIWCCFCDSDASLEGPRDNGSLKVTCPRCGEFVIAGSAAPSIKALHLDGSIIGGWIREQNTLKIIPEFDSRSAPHLHALQKPSFRERAEKYLLRVMSACEQLQHAFADNTEELIGATYSASPKELSVIHKYLVAERLIERIEPGKSVLTPNGFITADDLRTRRAKSSQGFVAMWFDASMNPIYDNGISAGIQSAGYKSMRVDKKEHANKIDDEIIAEIRRSAFVVADFTGHRGGVYFEAGFAMGLGLPVIWTCREDDMENLHFDIRQYNCIKWSDEGELARRLQQRVEAMLGRGPLIASQ